VRVSMRIALGLGAFLAVAGIVYAVSSHEERGTVLLLVCAVAFAYVGLVLRGAVREASVPVTGDTLVSEELSVESEHIGPTIWPFVLSIAALLFVIGLVAVHWVLIPTAILLLGGGAGWFLDIKRQRHPSELGLPHEPVSPEGTSTLEQEQRADDHDGE